MVRRRLCTLLLSVAVAAAAPLTAAQAATQVPAAASSAQPTLMQHIRPVDRTGHLLPGYSITARHRGAHCSAGSDAIGGDGYRCFAGKFIYDPCWVGAHKSFVYCLEAPWSFNVVRLHVLKYDNSGLTGHGSRHTVRPGAGQRSAVRRGTGQHQSRGGETDPLPLPAHEVGARRQDRQVAPRVADPGGPQHQRWPLRPRRPGADRDRLVRDALAARLSGAAGWRSGAAERRGWMAQRRG